MTSSSTPAAEAHPRAAPLPLLAFLGAAGLAALPVLLYLHQPLVDLPNHIARFHVAADPGGPLADYYAHGDRIVPNLAVDLAWRHLGHPGDPARFSQLSLAAYAVALVAATMLLARVVHGRWSAWPAAVALCVHNGPLSWGVQNFIVTVPAMIAALALWLALEGRSLALRVAVFLPVAAILFLMHLFGFAALAIAVAGRELQTLFGDRPARLSGLLSRAALALPFLLPMAWLLLVGMAERTDVATGNTALGGLATRLHALVSPVWSWSAGQLHGVNASGAAILFALLVLVVLCLVPTRAGPVIDRRMAGPLAALCLACVVAPAWVFGVSLVHIRLPVMLVACTVAAIRWEGLTLRQGALVAAVVAGLLATRTAALVRFHAVHDAEMRALHEVLDSVPRGARLLPLRGPGRESDQRLAHVQAYAVPHREAFVPTLFQDTHQLRVRERWRHASHPALFAIDARRILPGLPDGGAPEPVIPLGTRFWEGWRGTFTHVLAMERLPAAPMRGAGLELLAAEGRFSVWRIARRDPPY